MQRVFDPPMSTDVAGVSPGVPRLAADVVADLRGRRLTRDLPFAHHHTDRPQILPQLLIPYARRLVDGEVVATFAPTVMALDGFMVAVVAYSLSLLQLGGHTGLHVCQHSFLVTLHGQDIVAAAFADPPGNVLLAAHGIDGDDRSRQLEHLQQTRDSRDLIRFIADGHLS